MVLLGYNASGKSSAGNTILGKSAFDSKRSLTSSVQEGDTVQEGMLLWSTLQAEKEITTQNTPPDSIKMRLCCVHLTVLQDHTVQKGSRGTCCSSWSQVWDHMIVLFTFGDWLGDTGIELFIESEGEALQWILNKCRNRYHVFDNKNTDDSNQVTELFEKIEEMVAGNRGGCCFEIQKQNLQEVKNKRINVEKRAEQIKAEFQKRNELRLSASGDAEHFEMRLVLLGPHLSGISSTGNTVLGRQAFDRRIEENLSDNSEVAEGNSLFLIGKRLEDAKLNLLRSVKERSSGTHAFILVQSVDCSFAEEEKGALEKIMGSLGETVWNHTLVLFAAGDELGETPIELFIASEGDTLQWLIEKCGNRYHVLNTKCWGDGSQVTELLEKIKKMVAENRGCPFRLDEEALERAERTVAVPIRRAQSMDDPINFAEGCSPSSRTSSAYVSLMSQEAPVERHFKSSSKSVSTGFRLD
ncbi:GTPase IMAP family member 8 [Labeo rohita]|uniref:GTPase IMAP family member 8 n=1 Tax=Labeo rohita TaxID=84645 RepID=A0ABQ8M0J2_LABRO|nr:GTPase IMAP family member 8 [Labeo rohita]